MTSVRTYVLARYAKFLQNSQSREVAVMFEVLRGDDLMTTWHYVNLTRLETAGNGSNISSSEVNIGQIVTSSARQRQVEVSYLGSMLQSRGEAFLLPVWLTASVLAS